MKRAIFVLLFLFIFCSALGSSTEAKNKESSVVITQPDEDSFTTDKKVAFLNGKAPAGKVLHITVYSTADLKGTKYDLSNLPKNGEWIEKSKEDITVGKLGLFDKQLELALGINKLVVKADGEDKETVFLILVRAKSVVVEELVPAKPVITEQPK